MARAPLSFGRPQLLRQLPLHLLLALIAGAITGALLYAGSQIQPTGLMKYLVLIMLGSIYVNGATLPVSIPGRHWSLAFINALLMLMLLIAGLVLAGKIHYGHSIMPDGKVLSRVNLVTTVGMLTGGGLGLFYGLLAGHKWSMIVGAAMGIATGYVLGLLSLNAVSQSPENLNAWVYNSPLHFAWQCAVGLALLHTGASVGAIMGATGGIAEKKRKAPAAPADAKTTPGK
jgi:hypothetical protein